MAEKLVVTGQYNLVDEVTNNNVVSYDLASILGQISAIQEHNKIKRKLIVGDSVVTLDKGGVGTIKGFLIAITENAGGAPVVLKHNTNGNGMSIDTAMILHGNIDDVTIETTSTSALTVEYLFFE